MIKRFEEFVNEGSNLPWGAADDSRAPYNQKDNSPRESKPKSAGIKVLASTDHDIVWIEYKNKFYEVYLGNLEKSDVQEIAIDFAGNYSTYNDGGEAGYETDIDNVSELDMDDIIAWLDHNWKDMVGDKDFIEDNPHILDLEDTRRMVLDDSSVKGKDKRAWEKVKLAKYKNIDTKRYR